MDQPITSSVETANIASLANELQKESEKLHELAQLLANGQKKIAELEQECGAYRRLAYAWLAEKLRQQPPIPDKDVKTLIAELDGRPFEELITDLERLVHDNG
jgi:hypothetical protein